jgi:hypothetical protein
MLLEKLQNKHIYDLNEKIICTRLELNAFEGLKMKYF